MTERYIQYADRYNSQEPIISYHCYSYVIKKGYNNSTIQQKLSYLQQSQSKQLNDKSFVTNSFIQFINKQYELGQSQYKSNNDNSKLTFLLVIDMIDLLSEISSVPSDMQNVKKFIINNKLIPQQISSIPNYQMNSVKQMNQNNVNNSKSLFPTPQQSTYSTQRNNQSNQMNSVNQMSQQQPTYHMQRPQNQMNYNQQNTYQTQRQYQQYPTNQLNQMNQNYQMNQRQPNQSLFPNANMQNQNYTMSQQYSPYQNPQRQMNSSNQMNNQMNGNYNPYQTITRHSPQPQSNQSLFPTPQNNQNNQMKHSNQSNQSNNSLFPTPQPKQNQMQNQNQTPQKQSLFPTPQNYQNVQSIQNNSINQNQMKQSNNSIQQKPSLFPTPQMNQNIQTNQMNQNQKSLNQMNIQPTSNRMEEIHEAKKTIQPTNPILQKEVKVKEGITVNEIVSAWIILNKAKDSLQVGSIENMKSKIEEVLSLLEESN